MKVGSAPQKLQIEFSGLNAFVRPPEGSPESPWTILLVDPKNVEGHSSHGDDHEHMEHRPVLAVPLLDVMDATHTVDGKEEGCHCEELVTLPGGESWGLWDLTGYEVTLGAGTGVQAAPGAVDLLPFVGPVDERYLYNDPPKEVRARMQLTAGTLQTFLPDTPDLQGALWKLVDPGDPRNSVGARLYAERVRVDLGLGSSAAVNLMPLRSDGDQPALTITLQPSQPVIQVSVSNLPTSAFHLFDPDKDEEVEHFAFYSPLASSGTRPRKLMRSSGSPRLGGPFCPPAAFSR